MGKMPSQFIKQRTVLGVPVGKRQTDWVSVRKAGMVGLGAVSTVAAGLQALRGGLPPALRNVPQQISGQTRKVVGQFANAAGHVGDTAQDRAKGEIGKTKTGKTQRGDGEEHDETADEAIEQDEKWSDEAPDEEMADDEAEAQEPERDEVDLEEEDEEEEQEPEEQPVRSRAQVRRRAPARPRR